MAKRAMPKRPVNLRLIHDGVQPGTPLPETLHFGLQDTKGVVHPGTAAPGGAMRLDLTLLVSDPAETAQPVFRGAFVHGPPTGRFLYLSWRREGEHDHPWGWRLKIPLSDLGWTELRALDGPGVCLVSDVRGRRPHTSAAVTWAVEAL